MGRAKLQSVQSCTYRGPGVNHPIWDQDPNGEDAKCFTKALPTPAPTLAPTPAPTPVPTAAFDETPMKRSTTPDGGCTSGLTMYKDVWQCLTTYGDDSTRDQVAKEACSKLTDCLAVYTRPGSKDYVMVFGSRAKLQSVQSCTYRDPGVNHPIWDQDPNGEDAKCFTKALPTPAPTVLEQQAGGTTASVAGSRRSSQVRKHRFLANALLQVGQCVQEEAHVEEMDVASAAEQADCSSGSVDP